MSYRLNHDNKWARMPRWRKRVAGFFCYMAFAFLALWQPEAVDIVMMETIKEQFIEDNDQEGGAHA